MRHLVRRFVRRFAIRRPHGATRPPCFRAYSETSGGRSDRRARTRKPRRDDRWRGTPIVAPGGEPSYVAEAIMSCRQPGQWPPRWNGRASPYVPKTGQAPGAETICWVLVICHARPRTRWDAKKNRGALRRGPGDTRCWSIPVWCPSSSRRLVIPAVCDPLRTSTGRRGSPTARMLGPRQLRRA